VVDADTGTGRDGSEDRLASHPLPGGAPETVIRAAFFDLDKTVIDRASIAAFGRPFRKGGLISRRTVVRAVFSQLVFLHLGADEQRLARVRQSMLRLTKGWERQRVREIVRETLLQTIEPIIYAEALELMEQHRLAGHRVYLVSASPEEIVLPLAELLGADGAIATRGETDLQDRYTGELAFYAYGPGKAEGMRDLAAVTGIDLSASTAYSDSATDIPMLEAVGHPVAVNADRALSKVARERHWEERQFTKPIRIGNRVTRTTPVVTTSLALAGAAVLLWRHGQRIRTALPSAA
jgi:HAD superfamily hydrolase (TIGR01490 family)